MAIAKINKINIVFLKEEQDIVLSLLQQAGVVHLEEASSYLEFYNFNEKVDFSSIDADIAHLEYTIGFLSDFQKGRILKRRPVFTFKQIQESAIHSQWRDIYSRCYQSDRVLKEITAEKNRISLEIKSLQNWEGLNVHLENTCSTKLCSIYLGIIPVKVKSAFEENIKKTNISVAISIIREDEENAYLLVAHRKEDEEEISSILKSFSFQYVRLHHLKGTVKENIERLNKDLNALADGYNTVVKQAKEFLPSLFSIMSVYDFLYLKKERGVALSSTKTSKKTIIFQGWICKKDINILLKLIKEKQVLCEVIISEPQKTDNPPVVLENKQPIKPFEYITSVYGVPQRFEIDPTPFLAPFFFIFFGFCLTDAGYGIVIFLLSIWAILKFKPKGEVFYLLWILCLGGISTIFFGALCGGWFGNAPSMLANSFPVFKPAADFTARIGVLDPMANPQNAMNLMLIALGLGVVHILCGNIAGLINNIKNNLWRDAIMDQGFMLILLTGILGMIFSGTGVAPGSLKNMFLIFLSLGTAGIIIFAGRSYNNIGFRIFNGFYSAYNAWAGFLADVLSYSRLWALGLVTGVMATTVNMLAVQTGQIFWALPVIGPLAGITVGFLIILFGHTFAIAINILGALIHTSRLQFVEFFSKFFKGGGKTFVPFSVKTKYVAVKNLPFVEAVVRIP